MAITSEIIGKLGGADVQQIPVDVTASGLSQSNEVIHTVEVPEGETWLVAVYGNLNSKYSKSSSSAQLYVGDVILPKSAENGFYGLAHIGTGIIDVKLHRNTNTDSDSFTGHVYVAKL